MDTKRPRQRREAVCMLVVIMFVVRDCLLSLWSACLQVLSSRLLACFVCVAVRYFVFGLGSSALRVPRRKPG